MHETEAESGILVSLGDDRWDTVGVALDPYCGLRPGERNATLGLGQCRAEIKIERADEQYKDREAGGARPCHPPPSAGAGGGSCQNPSSRRIFSRSASRSGAG